MSLGVLVDNEGNDHYICGTGQGSGIHVTNAILIDKKGDDVYEGGFRAGGSGGDRSPGFLIDYEGNDTYISSTSSYGTACKPFAFSLLIDYKGNDKYICDRPKGDVLFNDWHSFGGVWPESDPNAWPYAICLDLGRQGHVSGPQPGEQLRDSQLRPRHLPGYGVEGRRRYRRCRRPSLRSGRSADS